MTLIATFRERGIPVLIGDVLISRTGVEAEHINIPTRNDVEAVLPREWQRNVCALYPKLAMINPHLAIAWTGNLLAAKAFLSEVRKKFGGPIGRVEGFFNFMRRYKEVGIGTELTLIGLSVRRQQVSAFKWSAAIPSEITVSDQFFDGSGAEAIARLIAERALHEQGSGNAPIDSAVQNALALVGNLIADDVTTGESLQGLYGGGYQVVVFHKGRLWFVNDYLFLFMQVKPDGDTIAMQPGTYFLKHTYLNDDLLIKRTTFGDKNSPGVLDDYYINAYVITEKQTSNLRLTMQDVLDIPLRSMYYCCIALCPIDNESHACGVFVTPEQGQDGLIKVEGAGGKETIGFHKEFMTDLGRHFRELLASGRAPSANQ